MKAAFSLLVLITLVACAPAPRRQPPLPPPVDDGVLSREPDSCGVRDAAPLRGQPGAAVARAGLKRSFRVIPPGILVTQEYEAQRINFYLDEKGLIARISCG